ncbi:hypothetical protein scyTo_0021500, partial [Scyliorhinus torazame]|nr:hypothetical protein [Scyliorhinus torazame]
MGWRLSTRLSLVCPDSGGKVRSGQLHAPHRHLSPGDMVHVRDFDAGVMWVPGSMVISDMDTGIYDGRLPILSIMDIDLIKTIFIKEFYTLFTNKRERNLLTVKVQYPNFGLNGLFEESLMVVEDDHWKRIRSVLSPSFTSGRLKE